MGQAALKSLGDAMVATSKADVDGTVVVSKTVSEAFNTASSLAQTALATASVIGDAVVFVVLYWPLMLFGLFWELPVIIVQILEELQWIANPCLPMWSVAVVVVFVGAGFVVYSAGEAFWRALERRRLATLPRVPPPPIEHGTLCPICLDELLSLSAPAAGVGGVAVDGAPPGPPPGPQLPLVYCALVGGCGKSVHAECQAQWMAAAQNRGRGSARCVVCTSPWPVAGADR